ncbi:MAG: Alpha/beta hydrolase family protein [Syntrophaceae bacterium PtaB.Bin038]|nr:MAG: Alpha/beta hydrolase family protein [Syntrophaceae bacterium PtaB.Bin038]
MDRRRWAVPLAEGEAVSAVLTLPTDRAGMRGTGVIVAHGAGNDMEHPLLASFADGLAGAGYPAMRFNFPYKEKGLKLPDPPAKLEKAWAAAFRVFREESGVHAARIVAAGKSMGGRIASQMASDGTLPVDGLIFLGYPLHPEGDPSRLRDAHLYRVGVPMLFFAGTRDRLCDVATLRGVLGKVTAPWELEIVEGGDHSFELPRAAGVPQPDVFARIVNTSIRWLEETLAGK